MADLTRHIDIKAPLDDVFRYVVSAFESDLGFWGQGIENWTPLSSAPLSEGFQFEYVARMLGIPNRVKMEVREFQPGKGWSTFSVQGPEVRGDWTFEPSILGTRFTYRLRYTMPPPLIGPLLDMLVLKSLWGKSAEGALENLKRQMEESKDPR